MWRDDVKCVSRRIDGHTINVYLAGQKVARVTEVGEKNETVLMPVEHARLGAAVKIGRRVVSLHELRRVSGEGEKKKR